MEPERKQLLLTLLAGAGRGEVERTHRPVLSALPPDRYVHYELRYWRQFTQLTAAFRLDDHASAIGFNARLSHFSYDRYTVRGPAFVADLAPHQVCRWYFEPSLFIRLTVGRQRRNYLQLTQCFALPLANAATPNANANRALNRPSQLMGIGFGAFLPLPGLKSKQL